MIDRFRKVEFELKFLNLIKKEVITDLELLQGTREQMPGLYKQYLELIQTGVLWTSKINYNLNNNAYMLVTIAMYLDYLVEFVHEFNSRGRLNINSPVIAFQMGGYIVSEVFLTAYNIKAVGLGYAYKDLYKTKIME